MKGSDRLRLYATTRVQRNVAAHEMGNAIARVGGTVLDHYAYSNIGLAVQFLLPRKATDRLSGELTRRGIVLAPGSEVSLRECHTDAAAGDDEEVAGALHLRFIHDEPDLRREVPPIPG